MALPTYYATGTASVANGSTDVTGNGTSWTTSIRAGDLFGTHKGLPVRIATVNSNTSLTLAYGWAGTTQTDAAYEIQLTPRTVGVQQAVLELLEILRNGNLSSIAELDSAVDTLAYYTGSGTSALTDITAKARTLLANSTTLAMLETLGPVFGGKAPVPSDADVGLSDGNFNAITVPGVYTITGSWTNGPLASGASATYAGVLVVKASSLNNGYWHDLFLEDQCFTRFTATSGGGGGWSAWTEMVNAGDLSTALALKADAAAVGCVLIGGGSLNGLATSPVITLPAGYQNFELVVTNLNFANGSQPFWMQWSLNGSTFLTGATDYVEQTTVAAGTSNVASAGASGAITLIAANSLNSAQRGHILCDVNAGNDSSDYASAMVQTSYINAAGQLRLLSSTAKRNGSVGRIKALVLFPGAGSIVTGDYKLYGYR